MNYKIYNFTSNKDNVYLQTIDLFKQLKPLIYKTLRTWIFVKDIDNTYLDFARARNEIFEECGLTKETHFIVSTCVGEQNLTKSLVQLKALVLNDFENYDIEYMQHTEIIPPTHTYNIQFERGVKLKTPLKNYYLISGTASIDKNGNVVHINNLNDQLNKTFKNIDELLLKYGSSIKDIVSLTVYVRNIIDIEKVSDFLNFKYKYIPTIIKHAHICRPDWLVEIECIAISYNL